MHLSKLVEHLHRGVLVFQRVSSADMFNMMFVLAENASNIE
jgi:hypothetical protein